MVSKRKISKTLTLKENIMEPTNANKIETASESRFSAAHFSEALTAYSTGWKDPENLAAMLDFIAPSVPVGRRFEFKKQNNAEAFLAEADDVRAIGSSFKRIEYSGTSVNEKTINKGLTIRVDHDEVMGDDWQERYVQLLVQRLYRNEILRAISALDQSAKLTKLQWSKTSNPDGDLRKSIITAATASGVRPNRILFSEGSWDARASTYESKDNAGAFRSADISPEELSRKLLVDDVRVIRSRYQALSGGKLPMAENAVYAFFGQAAVTKDEPSNIKRFVTPTDSGNDFRVYLEEHAKYTDISVEHYSNIVVTSDLGIQKLVTTTV